MHDPRLSKFVKTHGGSELPVLAATLRIAAEAFGYWTEPPAADKASITRHAVSHEIFLFGVLADGDSQGEVVRNWLKAATNLLEAEQAEVPEVAA